VGEREGEGGGEVEGDGGRVEGGWREVRRTCFAKNMTKVFLFKVLSSTTKIFPKSEPIRCMVSWTLRMEGELLDTRDWWKMGARKDT
jgi:hypothetical protein